AGVVATRRAAVAGAQPGHVAGLGRSPASPVLGAGLDCACWQPGQLLLRAARHRHAAERPASLARWWHQVARRHLVRAARKRAAGRAGTCGPGCTWHRMANAARPYHAKPGRRVRPNRRDPVRTITVNRYVTPLREGGSMPAIVEGDDLGTYVLKFRGAGQGVRALLAEMIAGGLAR